MAAVAGAAGLSAYAQPQGFWGFYAQHEQAIAFGASLAAGTALSIATWGIAAPEVAAALGVEATGLGIIGTAAVGAISGAAGGAGSGFVYGAVMGESPSQIAQSAGVGALSGGLSGGIFGGGFGAAGVALDNALALGSRVTAAFGQSYATSEEWASLLASRYGAESVSGSAGEGTTYSAVGSTRVVGENALRALGGESQVYFRTGLGGRYVDQFVGGIANESKVGYQSLTPDIQLQIAKDAELIQTEKVEGATWHFFQSPVTGLGGPSEPLLKALQQASIKVVIH